MQNTSLKRHFVYGTSALLFTSMCLVLSFPDWAGPKVLLVCTLSAYMLLLTFGVFQIGKVGENIYKKIIVESDDRYRRQQAHRE